MWCAISANRIIGPISYVGTLDDEKYITEILFPFFVNLAREEERFSYFMQDGATQHSTLTHTHTHTHTRARAHTQTQLRKIS
jgi:kynurenine formamidase